jgi:hypothetical protein
MHNVLKKLAVPEALAATTKLRKNNFFPEAPLTNPDVRYLIPRPIPIEAVEAAA